MTAQCLACAAGVTVEAFCAKKPTTYPGCPKYDAKDYHIKVLSNHFQVAKFPYLKVGSLNMKGSAKECEKQCLALEKCNYGTFVPKEAHHVEGLPEYNEEGECWLSTATHEKNYECGVDCYGFAKQHNAAPKPLERIPAPKKVVKQCKCDPFKHPSAFTHCHVNSLVGHIHVTHASVHFRKAQHRGGEQHVCKARKNAAGTTECDCCDCRNDATHYDMLHLGMSMYAIAKPYSLKVRVNSAAACRKQCTNRSKGKTPCKGGVFMPEQVGPNCYLSTKLLEAPKHCEMACDSFISHKFAKDFFNKKPVQGETLLSRFHR